MLLIKIHILDDRDLNLKISRYINDNLNCILRTLLDMVNDGLPIESILPFNTFDIYEQEWLNIANSLYEITYSNSVRDCIKPKYEYFLFYLLTWWDDIIDEEENLIPIPLPHDLVKETRNSKSSNEEVRLILNQLRNFEYYFSFCFCDYDFLTENLENYVTLYLRNRELFEKLCDIELSEYREIMPKDLRELYDEKNNFQSIKDILLLPQLLRKIFWCCERIQSNNLLKNSDEDDINSHLRDLLSATLKEIYEIRDQSRQGTSNNEINSGEVDILLINNRSPFSVIEALKLNCINKSYISTHIDKIYKYDTLGYDFNFIISYIKSKNFNKFWEDYLIYIKNYQYPHKLISFNPHSDLIKNYPELKIAETILERNGKKTILFHIGIHMME